MPDTQIRGPAPKSGPFLPVPAGAAIIGDVRPVDGRDDRMFRTSLSPNEAVRFYDDHFQQSGTQLLSRDVEPDGVTFRVRRKDGKVGTVIVRNSQPTVIETREPH